MSTEISNWKEAGKFFKYEKHEIFYLQSGKGPNLLILHGYPYSSFEWKECIQDLAKNYKVTIFDLLGTGFSSKPKDHKYSFEEHCDIINSLLSYFSK